MLVSRSFFTSLTLLISLNTPSAIAANRQISDYLKNQPSLVVRTELIANTRVDAGSYGVGKFSGEILDISFSAGKLFAQLGTPRGWHEVSHKGESIAPIKAAAFHSLMRCDLRIAVYPDMSATQLLPLGTDQVQFRSGIALKISSFTESYDRDREGRGVFFVRMKLDHATLRNSSLSIADHHPVYKTAITCLKKEAPITLKEFKTAFEPYFTFEFQK